MTRTSMKTPRAAVALIVAIVSAGAIAVAVRLPEIGHWSNADLLALGLIAGATIVGEAFSVKVRFGGETKHVTLTEAAYAAAMLIGVRHGVLTVAVAAGIAIAYASRGTAVHKTAYNAASYALAVTAAEVVFASVQGVSPLAAIALAMGAFFVVNATTVVGVIALATGKRFSEIFRPIAKLEGTHAAGNLILGTASVAMWVSVPAAVPVLLVAAAATLAAYGSLSPENSRLDLR